MEIINKINKMAESIDQNITKALGSLNMFEEEQEDIYLSDCVKDLKEALHTAITIQIALKYLNEYLEKIEEVLNDRNY